VTTLKSLDDKVEKVKDEVTDIKIALNSHVAKMDSKMEVFEDHITGDKKIINEITPMLEKLPMLAEMAEDHVYKKRKKEESVEKLTLWTKRLALISTVVGIVVGIVKLL
jgi:hypothetical protein